MTLKNLKSSLYVYLLGQEYPILDKEIEYYYREFKTGQRSIESLIDLKDSNTINQGINGFYTSINIIATISSLIYQEPIYLLAIPASETLRHIVNDFHLKKKQKIINKKQIEGMGLGYESLSEIQKDYYKRKKNS